MSSSTRQDRYSTGDSPEGKSKGNRLARRARSFKEDFLGILSQMRSPGGSGARAGSRAGSPSLASPRVPPLERPPAADLEVYLRQVQLSLKHFRDVIAKNKLEMLPGNGTVVLETVTAIHVLLKKYLVNQQSSALISATNQVYLSLAKLIRLCDDYLLDGSKALARENVSEVLQQVEDAIQNLVEHSINKLAMREACLNLTTDVGREKVISKPRTLVAPLDSSQRNSLPDIPLTPRERQILEQTSAFVLERHSHSSENILNDPPPPKPPHPDRVSSEGFPPPLPPKKRHKHIEVMMGVKSSLENLSLGSKSPGDSSSLFSESAGSLDSVLNHSRDDDLRNLLDDKVNTSYLNGSTQSCCYWDSSSSTSNELRSVDHSIALLENSVTRLDRLSGSQVESGFSSFQSCSGSSQQRSSTSSQQLSTRSSQISHVSQESHHIEKKICKESSSEISNGTNGISSTTRHKTQSSTVSSRAVVECSCPHDAWPDCLEGGDIISYCPTHKPRLSPKTGRIDNPLEDGWSLFSSPSQEDDSPPALPEKIRSKGGRRERHPSQYDNVPDDITVTSYATSEHHAHTTHIESVITGDQVDSRHFSEENKSLAVVTCLETNQGSLVTSCSTDEAKNLMVHSNTLGGVSEATVLRSQFTSVESAFSDSSDKGRPPLPLKKKHIMAYMEMFGNASHGNTSEFMRHSVHVYQQGHSDLASLYPSSVRVTHPSLDPRMLRSVDPPALPPKLNRRSSPRTPPLTPTHCADLPDINDRFETALPIPDSPAPDKVNNALAPNTQPFPISASPEVEGEVIILDLLDVLKYLVFKKLDDEGPEIRGGHPDALLVYATKAQKNDFLYQEAFLTTYRTFFTPLELIQKICWRYNRFICCQDAAKQRAAREGFSLLVRVVSDLTLADIETIIMQTLIEFVQSLICRGDLTMAKALRVVMIAKYEAKKLQLAANSMLPSHQVSMRQTSLLDLKSEQVAEQMTLLDAELFLKIEIPEVLIWAQEQNEERSPNLTRFTEHFNKMSYWARSRILEQNDAKDRERYVVKYIKIMKHLRKINNFNSYLALLSALDSAPIRRLEWQKHITEGLKDYCALIDSTSSFRAYRQALADTQPPCIPYIGLVLQDLTFVHTGNNNLLQDGATNFSKRWQQFNIVENMKKFKKGSYLYKKNERIISFFNGFDESLSEEAMWQISENIKPRGTKKCN